MTEQDKSYIATHKAWVEAQQFNIEEHQINMDYNIRKIALLNKQLNNDERQIKLADVYLRSGIEAFDVWCSNNGIDPNVEI